MDSVPISQLKVNPSRVVNQALDFPVAIAKRSKIKAYLLGKDLFEQLVGYLEDQADRAVIEETDFRKGKNFEKVTQELGI